MEPIKLRTKPPRQSGPPKRPRGLPFAPGNKANAGSPNVGRPKHPGNIPLPKGTREAFTVLSDYAFEALGKILADPYHPRHEQAAEYALNQKWGTARQHVEISDPNNALGGKHELVVTFANAPACSVAATRVPPRDENGPVESQPESAPAVVSTGPVPTQADVAVGGAVAVAVAQKSFLPWEREETNEDGYE